VDRSAMDRNDRAKSDSQLVYVGMACHMNTLLVSHAADAALWRARVGLGCGRRTL